MTFTFTTGLVSKYLNGELGVLINIPNVSEETLSELSKLMEDEKLKTVEIKYKKDKRSLDANAYAWVIMDKIAKKLNTTSEEIYIKMLKRYGVHDFVVAIEKSRSILESGYKLVEEIKDTEVNEKPAKVYKLILGSSKYDTLQMSQFINGIVEDAKLLGIETLTPDELNQMLERWTP